ncbi:hypothetical protein NW754_015215 [Fusarium falciforme]|nr:hypothetical protein NW754_015215 [Fusarium falciforme]
MCPAASAKQPGLSVDTPTASRLGEPPFLPLALPPISGASCLTHKGGPTYSKEESSSAILSYLRRIELKVNRLAASSSAAPRPSSPPPEWIGTPHAGTGGGEEAPWLNLDYRDFEQNHRPASGTPNDPEVALQADVPSRPVKEPIPFSARQTLSWPTLSDRLPPELTALLHDTGADYATSLEVARKPYPPPPSSGPGLSAAAMSVSLVKDLGAAYFATFNLANPILDRDFFLRHTLPTAITNGFGYDVESCVVLAAMALGCWGRVAVAEAGLDQGPGQPASDDPLDQFSAHETPGAVLFVELKRRMAFLSGDKSLQSCQCHLLMGLYYQQLVRPVDALDCVHHAASCSTAFWKATSGSPGIWLADMQSRLYWITLMFESVLTDELSLLTSRLSDLQDRVPLPKFVKMEVSALQRFEEPNQADAFCHYHFLSQIAHRVLINRIKETIYYSVPGGSYQSLSLEDEFTYQLEQWRHQLPAVIQFEVDSDMPPARYPWDVVVTPWLRARYVVAKWHIGRPFL